MCWSFSVYVEHNGKRIFYKVIGSIKDLKELYNVYEQKIPENLFQTDSSDDECLCYLSNYVFIQSIFGDIILNELNNFRCIGFKKHKKNNGYIIELEDNRLKQDEFPFDNYKDLLKICSDYKIINIRKINIDHNSDIKLQNQDLFEAILKRELEKDHNITFSWM